MGVEDGRDLVRPSVLRYARVRRFPLDAIEKTAYGLMERRVEKGLPGSPEMDFLSATALMVKQDRQARRLERRMRKAAEQRNISKPNVIIYQRDEVLAAD